MIIAHLSEYFGVFNVIFSPHRIGDPKGAYNLRCVRASIRALAGFSQTCIYLLQCKVGTESGHVGLQVHVNLNL